MIIVRNNKIRGRVYGKFAFLGCVTRRIGIGFHFEKRNGFFFLLQLHGTAVE